MLSVLPLVLGALPVLPAVAAALAVPGARAEVAEVRRTAGAGCEAEAVEALRPVAASGDVPLRLRGRDRSGAACEAFGWVKVRVLAPALRTTRALRAGEPLEGAVREDELELVPGRPPLAALPPGATAARALPPGAALAAADLRTGAPPGAPVTVVVRAGGIELALQGRAVACARGRACAVLPSGRRVEGRTDGAALLVEAP